MTTNIYKKLRNPSQKVMNFVSEKMESDARKPKRDITLRKESFAKGLNDFQGRLEYLQGNPAVMCSIKRTFFDKLSKIVGSEISAVQRTPEGFITFVAGNYNYFIVDGRVLKMPRWLHAQETKLKFGEGYNDVHSFATGYCSFTGKGFVTKTPDGYIILGEGDLVFLGRSVIGSGMRLMFIPDVEDVGGFGFNTDLYPNIQAMNHPLSFSTGDFSVNKGNVKLSKELPFFVDPDCVPKHSYPDGAELLETITEWGAVRVAVIDDNIVWAEWDEDSTGVTHSVNIEDDLIIRN